MSLRERLGLELPIIQAPMAGSQRGALAAAVSNAGGLGSLPCALLSLDETSEELSVLRRATTRPFNVNFFCHEAPVVDGAREAAWRRALAPYYEEFGLDVTAIPSMAGRGAFDAEAAELLEASRPAVVSFHFGLPAAHLLARVRATGALVISSATTVDEARWLEARGVDGIIAQGIEAGGHRGIFLTTDLGTQMPTLDLVAAIREVVRVPVIAAGGIASASDVVAALERGADLVQVGTTYLLCPEATTSPIHRAALESEAARQTALTNLFTGRPARGIVNRLMRELGPLSDLPPAFPLAVAAIAPLRAHAERLGSGDFSGLWAGQDTTGCRVLPAAEVTRSLAAAL